MKKIITICLILIFVLSFTVSITAAELCLEYSAASQYSTAAQGDNCWYYQTYTNGKYSDMVYTAAQNSWRKPDGGGNYITKSVIHPGVGIGTARVWEAPTSGSITIGANGNVRKSGIGGDGVTAHIYKNGELIWEQFIEGTDSVGYSYKLDADVSCGDRIYFLVTCEKDSYGATLWEPTVTYTQTAMFSVNGENVDKMSDVPDGSLLDCVFYDKDEICDDVTAYLMVYDPEDGLKDIHSQYIDADKWETRKAEISSAIDYGEDSYDGWETALILLTAEEGRFYSVVMSDGLCVR